MQTGLDMDMHRQKALERKKTRRLVIGTGILFLVVFCFSLCQRTSRVGFVHPAEVLRSLVTWVRYEIAKAYSLPVFPDIERTIRNELPLYFETLARFRITVLTLFAGGMLSLGGAVYQYAFRNPIAAPSILGVTTGVELGILLTVLQYGQAAYAQTLARYRYGYFFSLLILLFVLFAGKMISGIKKRPAVTDMLLVGMVLTQIIGVISRYYEFESEAQVLVILRNLSSGIYINTDPISFLFMGVAFFAAFVPLFLLRFSFNAVCFPDDDAYALGIHPGLVRYSALICATLLVVSAMIHIGASGVAMLSLIVPHFCRYYIGVDFKKLLWACLIYGGIILLMCRALSAMVSFGLYGSLPISTVVSTLSAPVFVIILLQQRRGWA